MVFFNWATMQMAAKIVYYGPGLCGKTTNLSYIYAKTAPGSRGEMVSLETETDRTLFFDLLPIEVGKVGGFRTRLQLYTVPGQVFYNTTRKLVLKGVDGLVFVADSQRPMADANAESFKNLEENLREMGLTLDSLPLVLQYNKRDLKNILSVEELNALLNPEGRWETFEAVAVEGQGVFETLKAITKSTLKSLRKRMATQEAGGVAAAPPVVRPQPQPVPAVPPAVSFDPAALRSAAAEGLAAAAEAAARAQAVRAASEKKAEAPAPAAMPARTVAEKVVEAPRPAPVRAEPEVLEVPAAAAEPAAPEVEVLEQPIPPAEEVLPPAEEVVPAAAEARTEAAEEVEAAEEPEEAAVEFATTADSAPAVAPAEMRHVKVSSSLDILAELETLRKSSTLRAESRPPASTPAPSFDLDSLLQASVDSRQEVKRKIEERVGGALGRASRCLVSIQLVDAHGKPLREVSPIEVELKRSERIRQLSMTLVVNLQGD
ncbi:MAG TPA: GTPase domain-containing protein [Thermoanaerobaculaceae bacterium]|nr:GTPase domain-containing protein [Thermoanaerobaculaceae bacterium]HRS15745.1 GTPase domain-containing protein [Thermoanaerobaculaceae bacterium]